jgi:CheY-like chemotaxis protein
MNEVPFTVRDENGLALKLGLNISMNVRSSIDTSCKSSMGTLPKIVNSLLSLINEDMASTAAGAISTKLLVVTLLPQRYTYSNRPLRILVVDDSTSIRKMAAMILSKAGHHVTVAAHGQEAVQLLLPEEEHLTRSVKERRMQQDSSSPSFDVVLMDIQMPVMDGLTAASIYRQAEENRSPASIAASSDQDNTRNTPNRRLLIIGMSACGDNDITTQAQSVGMDFFMPKPFSIHHFLAILEELDGRNKASFIVYSLFYSFMYS